MNTFTFTPDKPEAQATIPYFEQARAKDGWQGHASEKTADQLRDEMITALNKIGASVTKMQTGVFTIEQRQRAGIVLEFTLSGVPGRINLAALPTKSWTNKKPQSRCCTLLYVTSSKVCGFYNN